MQCMHVYNVPLSNNCAVISFVMYKFLWFKFSIQFSVITMPPVQRNGHHPECILYLPLDIFFSFLVSFFNKCGKC